MSVAFVSGAGTGSNSAAATSRSFTHTGIAGSKLGYFVGVAGYTGGASPTSVTVDGNAMTLIGSVNTSNRMAFLYGYVGALSASSTVTVTFAAAIFFTARGLLFSGVDQTNGWGAAATAAPGNVGSITISGITSVVNSYVVGAWQWAAASRTTMTGITDGTVYGDYYSYNAAGPTYNMGSGGYKIAVSTSENLAATLSASSLFVNGVACGIIAAKNAGSGVAITPVMRL